MFEGGFKLHKNGAASFFGAQLLNDVPIEASDESLLALILEFADRTIESDDVAQRLFKEFGTLYGVISAAPEDLADVAGMTLRAVAHCKFLFLIKIRSLKSRLPTRININGCDDLRNYLRARRSSSSTELFSVLYLDTNWNLMREYDFGHGTVNHVTVYPREIIKRALQIGASKLILLHNHPSRQTRPSSKDIRFTQIMVSACEPLGLVVADHVIVAGEECVSMRELGYFGMQLPEAA